jgi:hypothetical protein
MGMYLLPRIGYRLCALVWRVLIGENDMVKEVQMISKRSNFWIFVLLLATLRASDSFAGFQHVTVPVNSCYSLATQLSTNDNPCYADVIFLEGVNIDIGAANAGSPGLCLLPGAFENVDAVPSDYSKCNWDSYVEGDVGLAGKGLIVRDEAGLHHYKWRVQSNTLPQIIFDQVKID